MNQGNKADVYFVALLVPILLHVILLWNLIIFIYMKHYLIQALYVSNNLIMYWKKSFQCLETCSAWLKTWHCRFRNNMQVHKKVNEKRNKMAKFINCLSKSNSLSFNYKYVFPYQNTNINYTIPSLLNAQKSLEGIPEHQHH